MRTDVFALRHIGIREEEIQQMLKTVEANSLEALIAETIPEDIRLQEKLALPTALSEHEFLSHLKGLASKNKVFKSYIGLGYHESLLPSVKVDSRPY